jgi:hypothetical protein
MLLVETLFRLLIVVGSGFVAGKGMLHYHYSTDKALLASAIVSSLIGSVWTVLHGRKNKPR